MEITKTRPTHNIATVTNSTQSTESCNHTSNNIHRSCSIPKSVQQNQPCSWQTSILTWALVGPPPTPIQQEPIKLPDLNVDVVLLKELNTPNMNTLLNETTEPKDYYNIWGDDLPREY